MADFVAPPPLVTAIKNWILATPNIGYAPKSNGGWERWAQVDFSCWLNAHNNQTILEDQCFKNSGMRADLSTSIGFVVEFKTFNCGSEHVSDFIVKIYNDMKKLAENALDDKYQKHQKFCVGLSLLEHIVLAQGCIYPAETGKAMGFLQKGMEEYSHEIVQTTSGAAIVITYVKVQ